MKIAIVGSRKFNDYQLLKKIINEYIVQLNNAKITIVSGGAKGADALAEKFSQEFDCEMKVFYPNWELFGRNACSVRNMQIVTYADIIFAFWDGVSPGTKDSITKAEQMNKKLTIIQYK